MPTVKKATRSENALEKLKTGKPRFCNLMWTVIREVGVQPPKSRGEKINFMVDTGTETSVLLKPEGPLSGKQTWVQRPLGPRHFHGSPKEQ